MKSSGSTSSPTKDKQPEPLNNQQHLDHDQLDKDQSNISGGARAVRDGRGGSDGAAPAVRSHLASDGDDESGAAAEGDGFHDALLD